jgi:hypothetical protein
MSVGRYLLEEMALTGTTRPKLNEVIVSLDKGD